MGVFREFKIQNFNYLGAKFEKKIPSNFLRMHVLVVLFVLGLTGCSKREKNTRSGPVVPSGVPVAASSRSIEITPALGAWVLEPGQLQPSLPSFILDFYSHGKLAAIESGEIVELKEPTSAQLTSIQAELKRALDDPSYKGRAFMDVYESDTVADDVYALQGGFWIFREGDLVRVVSVNLAAAINSLNRATALRVFLAEGFKSEDAWTTSDMSPQNQVQFTGELEALKEWFREQAKGELIGVRMLELIGNKDRTTMGKVRIIAPKHQ